MWCARGSIVVFIACSIVRCCSVFAIGCYFGRFGSRLPGASPPRCLRRVTRSPTPRGCRPPSSSATRRTSSLPKSKPADRSTPIMPAPFSLIILRSKCKSISKPHGPEKRGGKTVFYTAHAGIYPPVCFAPFTIFMSHSTRVAPIAWMKDPPPPVPPQTQTGQCEADESRVEDQARNPTAVSCTEQCT